jgi:hypothetical protein
VLGWAAIMAALMEVPIDEMDREKSPLLPPVDQDEPRYQPGE